MLKNGILRGEKKETIKGQKEESIRGVPSSIFKFLPAYACLRIHKKHL